MLCKETSKADWEHNGSGTHYFISIVYILDVFQRRKVIIFVSLETITIMPIKSMSLSLLNQSWLGLFQQKKWKSVGHIMIILHEHF